MDPEDTSLINVFMDLPEKDYNNKIMENLEDSDESQEYYDEEYYYDEESGSGSGDGEEGIGDTDMESRVFHGGRMSLG